MNLETFRALERNLKPCPFCGGSIVAIIELSGGRYAVYCQDCRAEGGQAWSPLKAHNNWNQRKQPPKS